MKHYPDKNGTCGLNVVCMSAACRIKCFMQLDLPVCCIGQYDVLSILFSIGFYMLKEGVQTLRPCGKIPCNIIT